MHAFDGFAALLSNQKVEVPEIRGYRTKRLRLFLPLKPLSRGATTGVGLAINSYWRNENELLWLVIRRRCQQHALDEIENCDGRPDAEREREHGHGGETGVPAQHPQSESEIW